MPKSKNLRPSILPRGRHRAHTLEPTRRRRERAASVVTSAGTCASSDCSITSGMDRNPIRPSRNRPTATSLAAFNTTGRLRSASSARYARPRHGNATPIGSGEIEPSHPSQIQRRQRRMPPVRIGKRILNRQTHVGHAQLRDHRPVGELHQRVHDRLRMHEHVDLVRAHAEQPVRFDHLETLVHQRRGIDGDLPAHPPGRMLERVGGGDARQLRRRAAAKGSTRRGENQPADLRRLAAVQALVHGVVLAVDRQDGRRRAGAPRR